MVHFAINSLRLSDEFMHQETMTSLVQIMACCLFGNNPSSEPMMVCCQLDPKSPHHTGRQPHCDHGDLGNPPSKSTALRTHAQCDHQQPSAIRMGPYSNATMTKATALRYLGAPSASIVHTRHPYDDPMATMAFCWINGSIPWQARMLWTHFLNANARFYIMKINYDFIQV